MSDRLLIVDDDRGMLDMLGEDLRRRGLDPIVTTSSEEALTLAQAEDLAAVVTDLNMHGMNGLELCNRIVLGRPEIPVIVITAFGSLDTAIAAIRAGAYDFVTKPFELDALAVAIDRAIRHRKLTAEVRRLRRSVESGQGFDDLTGDSPVMHQLRDVLSRVVETDTTVLVTGESGTGKELVARAIHRRSRRAAGPFVAVNCAAVPEPLLESELFGHARGAFTDARSSRAGLFAQSNGGTLFLDEIGELPLALQPKLLRALQERCVRPVGGDREIPFDARIVAATNRDLETAIDEGRFREDLYFRVNVIHVDVPPLRSRGGDVLLLGQAFVRQFSARVGKRIDGLSKPAAERLLAYSWPGNVRELQNCIERAVALTRFDEIGVDDLPEKVRAYRGSHVVVASDDPTELLPLEEVEKRYILRVLEAVGGNKSLAARTLGVDRKTLYRKLERFGISSEEP